MTIIEKALNEIKPYENNPRDNAPAVDAVAASIEEFGFKVPIVIDKDGVIVAGHTRYIAAQKLGLETVPCIMADDLSDEQAKAFRLADNKVSELAMWDNDKLMQELGEIDMDMSEFGFDDVETPETEDGGQEGASGGSFNYKEQYGVIVMCENEAEQEKIYTRLTDEGYNCRVVAV